MTKPRIRVFRRTVHGIRQRRREKIHNVRGAFCSGVPEYRPQAGAARRNAGEKFNRQICIGITSRKSRAPERPRPGAVDSRKRVQPH